MKHESDDGIDAVEEKAHAAALAEAKRLEQQRTRHELARHWGVPVSNVVRYQDGSWGQR